MTSESLHSSSSSPASSSAALPSSPPDAGSSAGESYIGSFISLVSKYEIRYEGVLYYLNPKDSTLGLKNVRSFGTEGRKKDGPEIPPSDKVYEYILFRGNDIKDLQVKSPSSAQSTQEIPSDPGINQSSHSNPAMISSVPGSDNTYSSAKSAEWMDTPAVTSKPYPATQHLPVPLSFSPSLSADASGLTESSPTSNNFVSSMPMHTFMQGHIAAPASGSLPMMPKPVLSPTMMHNQLHKTDLDSSSMMGIVNDMSHPVTRASDLPVNPPYFNSSPFAQPQFAAPNSLSSYPASIQGGFPAGSQFVGKYDSAFSQPTSYEVSGVTPNLASVNSSPFASHQFLGTEQLLQSREQSFIPRQIVSAGGDMAAASKPISVDGLSRSSAPLLPLPVSAHQSRNPSSSVQFTEEFDFEAMNERFKKDEVWGFLGKNKQGNQTDEETTVMSSSEGKAKPAYNKDDFFDTISRNTLNRVSRNGHPHFSGRTRQDTEAFGNFQDRPQLQPGDGGYLTAQSNYNGGYNSGSGYGYYGGRGHVRDSHF